MAFTFYQRFTSSYSYIIINITDGKERSSSTLFFYIHATLFNQNKFTNFIAVTSSDSTPPPKLCQPLFACCHSTKLGPILHLP